MEKRLEAFPEHLQEPPDKRRRPKHYTKGHYVIGVVDSDVEWEVEALMEQDEKDREEEQEEGSPLAETSASVRQVVRGHASVRGILGRGRGGTRGRYRQQLHARSLASVSRLVFVYRSHLVFLVSYDMHSIYLQVFCSV